MSDVAIYVRVNQQAQETLFRQLEALKMKPEKRFRLAREAAREVKKYSSRRVARQQSLEGASFAPRSTKRTRYRQDDKGNWRKKRRLLENLGKAKNMGEYRDGEAVIVAWKKKGRTALYSTIAWKHQHGMKQQLGVTPEMKATIKKWHTKLRARKATKKMAQALIRNGYKQAVRSKGKVRLKRVPAKWIQENMGQMQAAWLLRMLVRKDVSRANPHKQKPQTWECKLPARPFLGVTANESSTLLSQVSQKIVREIKGK